MALRLICERETAISAFMAEEYWSITGEFQTSQSEPFLAKLFKIASNEPKIPDETTMRGYLEEIHKQQFEIGAV